MNPFWKWASLVAMWAAPFAVFFLLAACTAKEVPIQAEDAEVVKEQYLLNLVALRVVQLKDGTRCAVLTGGGSGGVHCDWKQ